MARVMAQAAIALTIVITACETARF